jgi:histidinol-phosphate phosphatase family protein
MSSPEQFELLPKVAEGIKLLNELGVKVIVVTNQSGIARGYFSEEDLERIHKRMIDELLRRGAKIDAIYYCPHHPNNNCSCRKPRIGMLERAAGDLGLDLNKCLIIGDKKLDIETGRNAGCTTMLIPGPETELNVRADYVAVNLYEAARFIKERMIK